MQTGKYDFVYPDFEWCIILKKVYSKVTLDINLKCKNYRGGKNEEPPRFLFCDVLGDK